MVLLPSRFTVSTKQRSFIIAQIRENPRHLVCCGIDEILIYSADVLDSVLDSCRLRRIQWIQTSSFTNRETALISYGKHVRVWLVTLVCYCGNGATTSLWHVSMVSNSQKWSIFSPRLSAARNKIVWLMILSVR